MLHVTNGTSVSLAESGLPGEILPWLDVLHEGPVPAGIDDAELCRVRTEFLNAGDDLVRRDRVFAGSEDLVLWFEHDLYDQLQLIQILDRCRSTGKRASLICVDRYLGPMTGVELAALWPSRHDVTEAEYSLASAAWSAFRASDPLPLQTVIAGDTSALPFLRGALRRHLQQFPSVGNGLGRTERQILQILSSGPRRFPELFVEGQRMEEAIFLGDLSFREYIRQLAPLVTEEDGQFSLTDTGREVLAGRIDRVREYGIDRWFGGVHLAGRGTLWRWEEASGRLQLA